MENKICVYAICKNEKKYVANWVKSMSEADYMVVLDTGSTDGTVEELKRYGVYVEQEIITPWRFDVARNKSLTLVPKDANILICTDLDELLDPGWAKAIKEKWVEGEYDRAFYKYAWSHNKDGSPARIFAYDKIHSRDWHWEYPVHEMLVPNNKNNKNRMLNLFDSVYLHHYPDYNKPRTNYLPLLELRKKENPDDYYGLLYLSHEYFYRKFYQKSIDTLFEVLYNHSDKVDSLNKASCYLFLGDDYRCLKLNGEAIKWYKKAIETEPTYREPYINLSKVLLEEKEFYNSKVILLEGLKKTYRHYSWLERDTSWTYEMFDLLSLSCYYIGEKKDSLAYAVKAYNIYPSEERLKNNVDIILKNMSDKDFL